MKSIYLYKTRVFTIINANHFFYTETIPKEFSYSILSVLFLTIFTSMFDWNFITIIAILILSILFITTFTFKGIINFNKEKNEIESYYAIVNYKINKKKLHYFSKGYFEISHFHYNESNAKGLLINFVGKANSIRVTDTENLIAAFRVIEFLKTNNHSYIIKNDKINMEFIKWHHANIESDS